MTNADRQRLAAILGMLQWRLTLIQWMLALLIGGVASLVIKAFV